MNLPNYFLADLPPEAELTAGMISEACQTLKRNRERYLVERPTAAMVRLLAHAGRNWLDPEFELRKLALRLGPAVTGFSSAILASGLDSFFQQLTEENLQMLLRQDLGHEHRLDAIQATEDDLKQGRGAIACGPAVIAHIAAGTLPNSVLQGMTLGILTRSAQFVKCASGTSLIPRLFAHSLYQIEPKVGACLEVAEWPGGYAPFEAALFEESDLVTVNGSDETLADVRSRLPAHVRFLGYGHRVSFGFISAEVLTGINARRVASRAAVDVAAWDQLGCLSPHVFYVQDGGAVLPEQFAGYLAQELAAIETSAPRGAVSPETAAAIASRRAFYQVRAANGPETRLWTSSDSTAWTVVFEAEPRFQTSCLNRFVYVKTVRGLTDVLQSADSIRGKVSTVGMAATESEAQGFVTELARWGVPRVCALGSMQKPPLSWRHDGHPALGDLVTWTDWEM